MDGELNVRSAYAYRLHLVRPLNWRRYHWRVFWHRYVDHHGYIGTWYLQLGPLSVARDMRLTA